MIIWSMAFMMTSKKSDHENSGFKLLWQMVCVLLTAGCMWIRYVLLKGFGWATERNATSLPRPGCCAAGQAESSMGKGDGVFPEREKTVRQKDAVSRGNVPLLAKGDPFDGGTSPRCLEGTGRAGCNWRSGYEVAWLSPGLKERTFL